MLDIVYSYLLSLSPRDILKQPCTFDTSPSSLITTLPSPRPPQPSNPLLPPEILLCIVDSIPTSDTKTLSSLRLVNKTLSSVATRRLFHTISLNKDLKHIQSTLRFLLNSHLLQYIRRIKIYEVGFYTLPQRSLYNNIFTSVLSSSSLGLFQNQKQPMTDDKHDDSFAGMFLDDDDYKSWMNPQTEFIADVFCVLEVCQNSGVDVEVFFDGGGYSWRRREGFKGLVEYHLGEGSNGRRSIPPISQRALAEWWAFRERGLKVKGF